MFYVYVLRSLRNGKHYTGSTANIERRVRNHNKRRNRSTKYNAPFVLIYKEEYDSRSLAYKREQFLKTGKGREELKNILGSSYNG